MSKVLITEEILSNIAIAIRAKDGSVESITPAAMAGRIMNMPSNDELADKIIEGSITEYEGNATTVAEGRFKYCTLESISLPKCLTIGADAFRAGKIKTFISIPNCKKICGSAFENAGLYCDFNIPNCEEIEGYAFFKAYGGWSIANLDSCKSIGERAFYYSALKNTSFSLPACTSLHKNAFSGAGLKEVHFAAANQTTIESLSGYDNKFGGSDISFYFDL